MIPLRDHPLASGLAPSWAWGWGEDRYGTFSEIKIGEVVQRMRWIFPGTFSMGSPESEDGRFEREGPRHQVQLTEGFWLADTPCTQELWQEVMGENPSRFKSPTRPVEQVSWEDCQRFLAAAEARQPGSSLRLPTEAQWEYACRAGTATATWLGDLEILGLNHAPLLDDIAWYGGNSGVDYDLQEGHDSSTWKERQHAGDEAGTRKAKLKQANPWGLYDMLGNVWEWCTDHWNYPEGYSGQDRTDPVGTDGALRVSRGGSWLGSARNVRAAYRYGSCLASASTSWAFVCLEVQIRKSGLAGRPGPVRFRMPRDEASGTTLPSRSARQLPWPLATAQKANFVEITFPVRHQE